MPSTTAHAPRRDYRLAGKDSALEQGLVEANWYASPVPKQYHRYRRLLLVARNTQELETYRPQAQEVAAYCARWDMRYEELLGSDDYLQRLVELAINFDQAGDDFLLIPPGGMLTQAQFMC